MTGAADAHGLFLHGLEEGGLGAGRGAVDLVGEDEIGEDRARLDWNARLVLCWVSSRTLVPRMSAGIRSGVNWMRLYWRRRARAMVRTRSVLPRPAGPPAARGRREQGNGDAADDEVLTDDDPRDLVLEGLDGGAQRSRSPSAGSVLASGTTCIRCIPSRRWYGIEWNGIGPNEGATRRLFIGSSLEPRGAAHLAPGSLWDLPGPFAGLAAGLPTGRQATGW